MLEHKFSTFENDTSAQTNAETQSLGLTWHATKIVA
jgi:hypothetical protein